MEEARGEKDGVLGLVGRMLTQSGRKLCGRSFQVVSAVKEKKTSLAECFWWRHVVQSESESRLMSGEGVYANSPDPRGVDRVT